MNETFMKEKPVFSLLVSMSLPMVISMLVNSLYNIVDSFFVAKISEDAMTALSLVYPVQNFINAVSIGFGVGINSVIAFYLGAGQKKQADRAASQGAFLTIVHALVMTVGCIALMPAFLGMFTKDQELIRMGMRYCVVVFGFTLINNLGLLFEKVFQAVGAMKVTMVSLIGGCVTNIILDPIMIFGIGPCPAMGIEGAALATGLGQTVSLVIYLCVYKFRPIPVTVSLKHLSWDKDLAARLYSIGIPAILNLALPSLLISALNGILSVYSPIYVVILGIYYKLQTFLYLPANGFVQGMRPLIGYNYGAGEYQRVRKIYQCTLGMSCGIMVLGTVICLALPGWLIGLFTSNPQTIAEGARALRLISAGFIISSVSFVSSGALEGLGKGVPSLGISLCRYTVIIIPAAFCLAKALGPQGVWHAFWISEAITAAVSYLIYRRSL